MKILYQTMWMLPAKDEHYTFAQERIGEINLVQIPSLWGFEAKNTFSQKQSFIYERHLLILL